MAQFRAYPFQRRVAELLLEGKSVVLQAPTGVGKTYAARLPFLEAWEQGLDFPRKCIYAVPMRVLANQFVSKARGEKPPYTVGIQTGERPEDPRFELELLFATIDQVLSSFLLSPYSLSRRQANLNAGAVASSYLVFDEFHLFDALSTLPTTLEMLRMLKGVVPFLLMTATFSQDMLQGLADALGAVVVPETGASRDQMQALESQQRTRRYHVCEDPLSADAVLARHKTRTLVICNQVARAQAVFRALKTHSDLGSTELRLLHSRFLREDRARIEADIRCAFAKDGGKGERWIAVSTQAIEVGLDITCETLCTELAPANAILQRAGRCARYKGETGDVHIFRQALSLDGEIVDLVHKVLPYRGMAPECESTWGVFAEVDAQRLGFGDEQVLISRVHGPSDRRTVDGLRATQSGHRDLMNAVWRGEPGAGQLIRQVSSQRLIIHDEPKAIAEAPFAYESFALHTGTLRGLVGKWQERAGEEDLDSVGIWALHELEDEEESNRTCYQPIPLSEPGDASGAALVVVDPRLATYNPRTGFLSDQGGGYVARRLPPKDRRAREAYAYRLESYETHARLTWEASRVHWPEVAYAAARLERKYGWPPGLLSRMSAMVALLHDTGKLSQGWQGWVRGYQKAIGRAVAGRFYAHTDQDPSDQKHVAAQGELGRRPPHAVEGALASAPLLATVAEGVDSVLKAALSAVARHHGAFAQTFALYQLAPGAEQAVRHLIETRHPSVSCSAQSLFSSGSPHQMQLAGYLIDPQFDDEFLGYVLLVRILRLADQEATAQGSGASGTQGT